MELPAARSASTPRSPSRCTSVGLAQGASVGMAAPTSCSGSGLGKEMPAQCYGMFSNSYQLCGARCAFLLPGRNLQCWVTWKISQGFGIPKQWGKLFSSWSWSPVANLISYKAWKCSRASSYSSQRLLIFFFLSDPNPEITCCTQADVSYHENKADLLPMFKCCSSCAKEDAEDCVGMFDTSLLGCRSVKVPDLHFLHKQKSW